MNQDLEQIDLAQAMKDGMRRLVSGVSVVSSCDSSGRAYLMTVSSVTSVSDDPPSLLVCISKSTKIAPVLVPQQVMAINVLSYHHQDVSITCSTGAQTEKRLETGDWHCEQGRAPLLKDAESVFECVVDAVYPYGTHNVVVAKITGVQVSLQPSSPLVYANGGYHSLNPV